MYPKSGGQFLHATSRSPKKQIFLNKELLLKEVINENVELVKMCNEFEKLLKMSNFDIDKIGFLLNKSWQIKKKLSDKISSTQIDNLYNRGIHEGASGGKVLGAGGGGYILFYVPTKNQRNFINFLRLHWCALIYCPWVSCCSYNYSNLSTLSSSTFVLFFK